MVDDRGQAGVRGRQDAVDMRIVYLRVNGGEILFPQPPGEAVDARNVQPFGRRHRHQMDGAAGLLELGANDTQFTQTHRLNHATGRHHGHEADRQILCAPDGHAQEEMGYFQGARHWIVSCIRTARAEASRGRLVNTTLLAKCVV